VHKETSLLSLRDQILKVYENEAEKNVIRPKEDEMANRDKSVSTVNRYFLGDQSSIPGRFFSPSRHPDCIFGPPIPLPIGHWGGVKLPERVADHSPSPTADI
jgi:hypothetical protein